MMWISSGVASFQVALEAAFQFILQNFSSLTLEQVYGAVAFYLAHEQEIDSNIREGEEETQRSVAPLSESRPELYARLEHARHEISTQDLAKY